MSAKDDKIKRLQLGKPNQRSLYRIPHDIKNLYMEGTKY